MANDINAAVGSPLLKPFDQQSPVEQSLPADLPPPSSGQRLSGDRPPRPEGEVGSADMAQHLQDQVAMRELERQAKQEVEEERESADLEALVESVNGFLQSETREVRFKVDERDGQTVTSVFNQETDELIREIPNEELRELDDRLRQLQGAIDQNMGLFVDKLV